MKRPRKSVFFVTLHFVIQLQQLVCDGILISTVRDNYITTENQQVKRTFAHAFEQLCGADGAGANSSFNWFQRVIVASAWTLCIVCSGGEKSSSAGQLVNNADDQQPNATDVTLWPGDKCDRPCNADTKPRLCYYSWTLEHYAAMGSACNPDCTVNNNLNACHPDYNAPKDRGGRHHQNATDYCIPLDGVSRTIMTVNRQLPGPPVHVCRGDYIVVDIANHMHGTATAIHWHGAQQRNSQHMDGVPYVTQCPIPFGQRFRYAFGANEVGTHFYHAHAGHHKSNGLYGAMVVRNVNAGAARNADGEALYDADRSEHVVLISDALHALAESLVHGLPDRRIRPESLLINGRGKWIHAPNASSSSSTEPAAPLLAIFHVRQGRRYRFRIINSASHMCPVRLQIERHRMWVIASDGEPVEGLLVDALFSSGGERYDVVLWGDGEAGRDYWMRVRVVGACETGMGSHLEQFAVVRYAAENEDSAAAADDDDTDGSDERPTKRTIPAFEEELQLNGNRQLNHPESDSTQSSDYDRSQDFCIAHLRSTKDPDVALLNQEPDQRFTLAFANRFVDNNQLFQPNFYDHFMNTGGNLNMKGTMNNISFGFPHDPPLLRDAAGQQQLFASGACDEHRIPSHCASLPAGYPCTCTHLLRVPLNASVELRLIDDTHDASMSHPFHLHGNHFYVMAIGSSATSIEETLARIATPQRPSARDTVTVPRDGFVVVRFRATNPGYWLLHCHFEWHLSIGMAVLLQVGEPARDQRPPVPRDFPRCDDYRPAPVGKW